MIYIKTMFGWYDTGVDDVGQLQISWNQYARVYWDTKSDSYVTPGNMYSVKGLPPLDPATKLQLWIGKEFPLFNVDEYKRKLTEALKK